MTRIRQGRCHAAVPQGGSKPLPPAGITASRCLVFARHHKQQGRLTVSAGRPCSSSSGSTTTVCTRSRTDGPCVSIRLRSCNKRAPHQPWPVAIMFTHLFQCSTLAQTRPHDVLHAARAGDGQQLLPPCVRIVWLAGADLHPPAWLPAGARNEQGEVVKHSVIKGCRQFRSQ